MNTLRCNTPRRQRGFSMIELLVALTISATLLTAALVALDTLFKRYTVISDSAGTHVVSRMVMHRMLSMIRTGSQFGPYPADVLDPAQNPVVSDFMEFLSRPDRGDGITEVTRIERRDAEAITLDGERFDLRGPSALWLVISRTTSGVTTTNQRPLIDGVSEVRFVLHYDVGPTLQQATIDLTVQPRGSEYSTYDGDTATWTVFKYDNASRQFTEQREIQVDAQTPAIRLISSTSPRSGV